MKKIICFILLLLFFSWSVFSQNNEIGKGLSSTYLIKNAYVVQKPGVMPENTSILVRDGLISEIGRDIKAPFNAVVVDADSMYIYPGLIDAFSNYGLPKEDEKKDLPRVSDPGNPPLDRAGITPQNSIADKLNLKDNSLMDLKKEGFTAVNVAPKNGMLPGNTHLLLLNENSANPVLRKDVATVFQYTGARGVYPSTNIAVISKFREMLKNAQLADRQTQLYNANPVGLERPKVSDEIKALIPAARKELSIVIPAKSINDVYKSLSLQKELGFNLVLADVRRIIPALDEVKKSKTQLILSLALPKAEEDKDKSDKTSGDQKIVEEASENKDTSKADAIPEKDNTDPELSALNERKKKAYEELLDQAPQLEKNGINFSFSARDVKANDVRKNLKRLIEAGLSEQAALAALTVNPANLLGVGNILGTIEKGKMANLFITDKPWLDEKSKVRYVMVEGRLEMLESKKEKPKTNGETEVDVTGAYKYEVNAMGQTNTGKMTITKSGNEFKVKLEFDGGMIPSAESDNVIVDGNSISFSINMQMGPQNINLDYDLQINGNDLSGDITVGDFGSFPIKGTKVDPKK